MKTRVLFGLLLPTLVVTTAAFARDKAACLEAASRGQRLRDTHKLVEAREELRACAAIECPSVVQSDCANWLAEVEKALPSVVLTAKNGSGVDLADVKVSVDGQPLASRLDGRALPMNAGSHSFRFVGADGASLDQQVLVTEGEKNQRVAVVLGQAPATPLPLQGAPTAGDSGGSSGPSRTVGWVLAGAGVAGLGVATAFGIIALEDKNAHCDANNVCASGTVGGIKGAALASDVGWIAGGVLLASGAALVLFAPRAARDPNLGVRAAPVVTASGGGLVVGASWW
jgi:hypothetical protein